MGEIDKENIAWRPSEDLVRNSNLTHFLRFLGVADFDALVKLAEEDPDLYWNGVIQFNDYRFIRPYSNVRDTTRGAASVDWCQGGTTNVVLNCLDKWRDPSTYGKTAVIYEDEAGAKGTLSYSELDHDVCRLAGGLRSLGLGRNDVIGIYLPTSPEAMVAFLAIAKIGAIVLPMFSGFGPDAIAIRVKDANAKAIVTVDGTWRRGQPKPMKPVIDEVASVCPCVEHVILRKRTGNDVSMMAGRDHDWDKLIADMPTDTPTEEMRSSDPMLLAYTSGTTGKPKGVVHDHVGFANKVGLDMCILMDLRATDRFMWMSDMGWLVGPLTITASCLQGATVVLVEGAPNAPEQDRFWRIISEHRVSYLGVAPTVIRTIMPNGADQLLPYDLSCLRVFASTGEAWTPEAWNWLFETVGKSNLPILNMSGGTELVDILTCTVIHPIKPCSFSIAVPGMNAGIYDDEGAELAAGQVGELVVRSPCLGMTRSLWNDEERYIDSYWSKYPGVWHHGDFASRDRDGFWYIHGRSDDVMKIAGKRISPSEIEALVLRSDKIVEAAAVGSKDIQKGQKIVCACVLESGVEGSEILADEVRTTVELGLGRAFRPKEIVFVDELPKTRNLKVLRRVIVAVFEGRDVGDLSSLSNPQSVDDLKNAICADKVNCPEVI